MSEKVDLTARQHAARARRYEAEAMEIILSSAPILQRLVLAGRGSNGGCAKAFFVEELVKMLVLADSEQ